RSPGGIDRAAGFFRRQETALDRQPDQARAGHGRRRRLAAAELILVSPTSVRILAGAETLAEQFEAAFHAHAMALRDPERQGREVGVGIIRLVLCLRSRWRLFLF